MSDEYDNYFFYISVEKDRYSNKPFYVNQSSSKYTRLAMLRDNNFSLSAEIEGELIFKVYAVPKQPGDIYNTTNHLISSSKPYKYKIHEFKIEVSESENRVTYLFESERFPEITFYQRIMEDDTMYISNPELIIKTEFLESLIK